MSSALVSQKSNKKVENFNKSGNLSDQRTLKVRIKVGPDSVVRKNAAIYSGLGLDNSPSSSLGNSPRESDGMMPSSQQIAKESPTSILQMMTSFPVPGGVLISPLHDSLLYLMRKDRFSRDTRTVPLIKCSQDNFVAKADESVYFMGNGKLLKGKEVKFDGKSERAVEVKNGNDTFENSKAFSAKKKKENGTPESKDMLSNKFQSMPLLGTANDHETQKATGRPFEVPRAPDQDGVRDGLFSSDLIQEDSSESRSCQGSGKSEKRNGSSGSVEKFSEHRAVIFDKDSSVNLRGNATSKNGKASVPSKGYSDVSKYKDDLKVGAQAPPKQRIGQQAAFHVQDEISVPCVKEKRLKQGKKSHGNGNSKRAPAILTKERSGIVVSGSTKNMMGAAHRVPKSKDKANKLKLQKDISTSRHNLRDPLDLKLEKNSQMAFQEGPSGSWRKEPTVDNLEMEHYASLDRSRERFRGKRVGNQPIPGPFAKDVAYAGTSISGNGFSSQVGPSISGNGFSSQAIPPVMDPIIELENWVCCDSCQKWRLLPYGTKPEQLPEKWLCSMLNWLHGMNHCDISEEETTKAVHASYAVGQSHMQNHANGITSGVNVQHVDHNYQSLDSRAVSSQGKKKHGLKEIAKAGTNSGIIQLSSSAKNHLQDSVKSRNLNDMNQFPAEVNVIDKSSFHPSKSNNLAAEQKEDHIVRAGDTKRAKMKNNGEANNHRHWTSKKTKREDASHAHKHSNLNMDHRRMDLNSKGDMSTKASGKDLLKSNEHSFLGDVQCDTNERLLVSVKNLGDVTQVSSDGGCFDMKANDKMNISIKKRKLKEWQDNQKGLDNNLNTEEIGDKGLTKEKKLRVSKSGASSMNNNNDNFDKKEKVTRIISLGSQDHKIDGVEALRSMKKDKKPWKHRKKFTSEQTMDGVDSLRKDLGPGQLSRTATSSSSKVSDSLKTRANFDDLKGSPVESVSSSPLRTSFTEKLGSTRGNVLGKGDASNGGLPIIDERRRCRHGEDDGQINQSGTARREKVSGGPHPDHLKNFPSDYQNGGANHKIGQPKCSDLLNGATEIMENHQFSSDLPSTQNCRDEAKADRKHHENVLFQQKFGKGSSLRLKHNDRNSTSDFDRDDSKFSEPVNEHCEFSKKSIRYDSEIDPRSHALCKRINNVKHSIPEKPSSKSSKDEKILVSSIGCSKDNRIANDDSDAQRSAKRSRKLDAAPKENLVQDFDSQTKRNTIQKESRSGTPDLFAHTEREAKHDSQSHQSVSGSQQEEASIGFRVHASSSNEMSKASRHPGNPANKSGAHQSLAHRVLDMREGRDLNAPSPGGTNSSSQSASNALKEAKDLRDYADRLKVSGFGFESNETNFQAARKFLHGASLLETSNEVGRQVEMTQMQVYSTAAKLSECCALEYERRHEMAAAALAYKCVEVAYWRVVYCKNSSLSRDRNELQACVQTFSQGESPSSSASDIDNLNNQATMDKAAISKGTFSHIAGNPVIVARKHPNFLRLLDFMQDVNFAVEASRKSQNAYSAANAALEEAENSDCIVSVKKVIDFSFQDVEELIRLLQHAMEAITRAGLVGARD
ncbi:cysteine-tryptophan domain-containing zinc finger protein 7 isoform X2 [Jatropha curcas]|nr:cysteine-tryptophan domain-containing zinc finger protein 7 isoform X2 [Jatropha curcas]